jgi:hypothetical protein
MSWQSNAQEIANNARNADEIRDAITRYQNSKRASTYGPETSEIEAALSILYRALDRF